MAILKSLLIHQPNFRDLGGIPTAGGKRVISGLLYRSGDLSSLSLDELSILDTIGIKTIVDFRSHREAEHRPDLLWQCLTTRYHFAIYDGARDRAERYLLEENLAGMENVLETDYRRMVRDNVPEFRQFMQLLASPLPLPLLFHCAAGKDRTGLASLFLLAALGVTMEVIRQDYMESNQYLHDAVERILSQVKAEGKNGELLRPLLEVREAYLDAALDEIALQFGSLDAYLAKELLADIAGLRTKYLTV